MMASSMSTCRYCWDGNPVSHRQLLPRSSIRLYQISGRSLWRGAHIYCCLSGQQRLQHICGRRNLAVCASRRSFMSIISAEVEEVDLSLGPLWNMMKRWRQAHVIAMVGVLSYALLSIPSAGAVDALKTCTCLLKECRVELAKCIANPSCAANVACLQTCNDRPDETECQIKCGDLFENKVVDEFNECAVSRKKCVPRKSDVGEFPVPDPSNLVQSFNMSDFSGKWYITSGLNPTFDTFDCQLHEFHVESNKLVGNLTWRIRTPDGGFFTRSAVQKFVQDPNQPGIFYNHDNEYLKTTSSYTIEVEMMHGMATEVQSYTLEAQHCRRP